jgi:20S proteasome alpha/beta subunit
LTSILLEPSSVEKILEVDSHVGVAVSGLIGGKLQSHVLLYLQNFIHYQDIFRKKYSKIFTL